MLYIYSRGFCTKPVTVPATENRINRELKPKSKPIDRSWHRPQLCWFSSSVLCFSANPMEVRANQSIIILTALLHPKFQTTLLNCCDYEGEARRGCRPSDIAIEVSKRDTWYHGVQGSTVTFQSPCPSPMVGVRVACAGINYSNEALDTSVVEIVDSVVCVLQQPIVSGKPYQFDYAVAAPINFRVISGRPACGNWWMELPRRYFFFS